MKCPFFILLLFSFFCSQGQPVIYHWYSKITDKIDQIQKTEFDSVYSYIIVNGSTSWADDVKGIGTIFTSGKAILIGFKNNSVTCIKIIESTDSVFRSKPIDLKFDSMLQSLRVNVAGCESEVITPYMCQIYPDSASDIKGFYPVGPRAHASFCCLYFRCSTKSDINEFDPESLSEKYENSNGYPPNLNFKYNSSLKSYKLYSFLTMLLANHENQFDFGK